MMSSKFPDDLISRLRKPSSYLGTETNSVHKDISKAEVKLALIFPDFYEIGMSNLGLSILYKIVNAMEGVVCERAFLPGFDLEEILTKENKTLSSLESYHPLKEFDILGFTLQYEMSCTSILHALSLSHIPSWSQDRTLEYPLIIGGGPSAFNPEPVADFFDLFLIGDAEESLPELLNTYKALKKKSVKKEALLSELSKIDGVYVPSLFQPLYDEGGNLIKYQPTKKDYTHVKKRTYADFNSTRHLLHPLVPFSETVHDRLNVEIDRGCTQGCRFCQAGYIYRPLREKNNQTIINLIENGLRHTGYDEFSLSSLNSGKHTGINQLIKVLIDQYFCEKVSLSLPSLRPNSITPESMKQISKIRKTGFTLAPEAGSQRLRNLINKDLSEEEILESITHVLSNGWKHLKLYFMIGLPAETLEDVSQIFALCEKITIITKEKKLKYKNMTVSISCFVPKPHTPFERCAQDTVDLMKKKQNLLRDLFDKKKNIKLKLHNNELSFIEAVFARGDRRLSKVVEKAYKNGCKLDGWSEFFNFEQWINAFEHAKIDPAYYATRQIPDDSPLAWDHIQIGVNPDFFKKEFKKALSEQITPDCRRNNCYRCGLVCQTVPAKESNSLLKTKKSSAGQSSATAHKYLIQFEKTKTMKFLSHLETSRAAYRACRRAKIPLAFSQGFHPHPKISFESALPVGIESLCEKAVIGLREYLPPEQLSSRLNEQLPEGFKVNQTTELKPGEKPLSPIGSKTIVYKIHLSKNLPIASTFQTPKDHDKYIYNLLHQQTVTAAKKKKTVNLSALIEKVKCESISDHFFEIKMTLTGESDININPKLILEKLYSIDQNKLILTITKLNSF